MLLLAAQEHPALFYQKVRNDIRLPAEAGKKVLRLFTSNKDTIIITNRAVVRMNKGDCKIIARAQNITMAAMDARSQLWWVSGNSIRSETGKSLPLPGQDSIRCLFWKSASELYLGTVKGLYIWNGQWSLHPKIRNLAVNDIVADGKDRIWVASSDGLWRGEAGKWYNLDDVLMAEGNHRSYYALAITNQGKDIIFSSKLAVGCIAENGEHWMWRSTDGLPYGPVRTIRIAKNGYWMGTNKGVIQRDSTWHYYHGERWMRDSIVNDILVLAPDKVWIATNNGLSEIAYKPFTLLQKAQYYDSIIDLRHNRRGLVNISKLAVPGDVTSSYTENEDNDGLWSSCYLAAQCYRYANTKSEDARQKAILSFEALERLEAVTGISGYPARSYALITDSVKPSLSPHPKHWHISPDGKWRWLDDTSSDEITGHMYTISLFYELVADTTYRLRAKQLIQRMMDHIVDNQLHLIDYDGKPTRWGIWHPDSLNHSPNWMYERSLNSLQILSFLKTAKQYTGITKYDSVYKVLTEKHGYAHNALYTKIYGPFETSHSDDILNFFPYHGVFGFARNDKYFDHYVKSLDRSWRKVANDRMPVWNVIASALLERDCGLGVALEELRQYPLDLVDWTMDNSHRWDLQIDPLVDRGRKAQAVYPVPTAESGISRWNTNPKRLTVGNAGRTEETGTYYLFAYWMGRYYGFWQD